MDFESEQQVFMILRENFSVFSLSYALELLVLYQIGDGNRIGANSIATIW